ncbi:MAG TPA: ATP-binding protein, partial [bacterium]|nr:ATP-binding protein [bacterium]
KEKGTGLGLSVSHRIVQEHGGLIQVVSEESKGTTFTVLLPLYAGGYLAEVTNDLQTILRGIQTR